MQVHLCGVRGSSPSPGSDFVGVGGHTSCIAIGNDGTAPSLVLDAGTGLSNLTQLLNGHAFNGTIVLGHLHWDHIMGLPFFAAGDRPDANVSLRLPDQGRDALEMLTQLMGPPFFPITPLELRGSWKFSAYGEECFAAGEFTVTAREIPHKGGRTMGLRVTDGRRTIAYLSDHSPHDAGPGHDGLGELHPAAVELASGVDLLIHDAQYTSTELPSRSTFGHAAAQYSVTLGRHCRAGRVLLFHHDPCRTDAQVHELRDGLDTEGVQVDIAVENSTITI